MNLMIGSIRVILMAWLCATWAGAVLAATVPTRTPDAATAFEWAEWKYPLLFPAGPASQPLDHQGIQYTVRSYSTGNLIGISTSGEVVGYGPFTGFVVQSFGKLATLAPSINGDVCTFKPAACLDAGTRAPVRLSVAGAPSGRSYVLALLADDSVIGWSLDMINPMAGSGQRLLGTVSARHVGIRAKAIAAGPRQALALGADGVVRGWGYAGASTIIGGEYGIDRDRDERVDTPVPTTFPSQVVSISVIGTDYAMAVRADGTLWHLPGEVTQVSTGRWRNVARQVPGLAGVRSVRSVVGSGSRRGVAIGASGTVWEIALAQSAGGHGGVPTVVTGLPPAVDAVCQARHCLALANDGTVWAWGQNVAGSLGNGSTTPSLTPIQVPGLSGVVAIAAGEDSSHALTADGRLWNWGRAGAAGMGQVSGSLLAPTLLPDLDQIVEVSVGSVVLVRRSDGSVWGWGPNYTDELGVGMTIYSTRPVQAKLINLNN